MRPTTNVLKPLGDGTTLPIMAGAVIYIRVSTKEQTERAPLVRRAFEEYATGQFTKQQLLQQVTARGLRNRRGQPLSSQSIGMLLRNQLYAGIVDVAEYGARPAWGLRAARERGHLLPGQAVLSGRTPRMAPHLQGHPEFPNGLEPRA